MALGEVQFHSHVLEREISMSFYVPGRSVAGPFPVVLLLHGRGGNHRSWLLYTRTATYLDLEGVALVAVIPDGGASDWTNTRIPGQHYEDFLIEDVLPSAEHILPIEPRHWAVSGWSMGATGALRLGLKHPDLFRSVAAHCPPAVSPQWIAEQSGLSAEAREDLDLYGLANRAVRNPNQPVVSIDCGIDDPHLSLVRGLHEHLDGIGYPHEYREPPGSHIGGYWDAQVQRGLAQHMTVFESPDVGLYDH